MGSPENTNWFLETFIDDIPVATADFGVSNDPLFWPPQPSFNPPTNLSVEIDSAFANSDAQTETGSKKRQRSSESSGATSSKACREKMRRDRLNDRFLELGSILDPGKTSKFDKAAILSDAARTVVQLRNEAQSLKDANESLQEKIKELKAEKIELRDEKQRLKVEKEALEHQVKLLNARPSFIPHPPVVPAQFPAPGQAAAGQKLMMPIIGYPGFPMWQYMPPADVDTSQDADKCPPVA